MQHKALTIAGSDSGGGAGIQADLKTFMAHGVYGASAITAITAQNTLGVHAAALLDAGLVAAQIDAVLDDIGADAVKTGMLGSAAIVEAVVDKLLHHRIERLVVDPVMIAKHGERLLDEQALDAMRTQLLPLALIMTPHLPAATALLGHPVETEQDMLGALSELAKFGSRYVLLKGGHLAGDPVDMLFDGSNIVELRSARIPTPHTHGTGCTYAAAITALLARGLPVQQAVHEAREYLIGAIAKAEAIGGGLSPVKHLWRGIPLTDGLEQ